LSGRDVIDLGVLINDAGPNFPTLSRGKLTGRGSTAFCVTPRRAGEPISDMFYQCVATSGFMRCHFANGFDLHAAASEPAVSMRGHTVCVNGISPRRSASRRYRKDPLPSVASLKQIIVAGLGYGVPP
jgi:LysR family transcriptional regulator (chromosome initiation inhibitor)